MIHYQLRCANAHEFEGWFPGSASFEAQAEKGLLSCPRCGIASVSRGLMAPAVRTRSRQEPSDTPTPANQAPTAPGAGSGTPGQGVAPMMGQGNGPAGEVVLPDEMRAVLQKMRAEIERNCDDMGDRFAEEAIRMNRGETRTRGIYGNASQDDREALADEGIAVMQIPWLKPAES